MGVLRPELVMRSIIPVVMAGVLGTSRVAYIHDDDDHGEPLF